MRCVDLLLLAACSSTDRPSPRAPREEPPEVIGLSRARELANGLFMTGAFFATVTAFKTKDALDAQRRAESWLSTGGDAYYQQALSDRNTQRAFAIAYGSLAFGAVAGGTWLYLHEPPTRLRPRRPNYYGWKLALADLAAASAVGLAALTYRPPGEGEFAPHPDNTLPVVLVVGAIASWGFTPLALHLTEDEEGHMLSSLAVRGTAAYIVSREEPSVTIKVGAVLGAMLIDDLLLSMRCLDTVTIAPLPGGATAGVAGRF